MLKTVKVPKAFEAAFGDAERFVERYFASRQDQPERGTITIGGERYILIRAASMSVHFLELIQGMYPALDKTEAIEAASRVLFDLAHSIGRADARAFHAAAGVEDPIARLSSGPIHFAYAGWAFVDILEESRARPDDDYYLVYDHPQSFEADSWLAKGQRTGFCACFMNSGYSSGWCSESFSLELVAREILCRARHDPFCRFIMAPVARIGGHVEAYVRQHPALFESRG